MSPFYKTTLAALMFLTLWSNCAVAHDSPGLNLQVSVFNRAQLPDGQLIQAEARAEKIMSRAGIRVTWLNCLVPSATSRNVEPPSSAISESCRAIHYPEHLAVTILERPKDLAVDTFGQAFLNEQGIGSYIDVYYERVSALRTEEAVAPAEILGCVIAHEIGHLELGADSHSNSGLMRAHWDSKSLSDAAKGQLLFSPSQVVAMQATLTLTSQTKTAQQTHVVVVPNSVAQAGMP